MYNIVNFFMFLMCEVHFENMLRIHNTSCDHFLMVALIHFYLKPVLGFIGSCLGTLTRPFRFMSKTGLTYGLPPF